MSARATEIETKLRSAFAPEHLEVENESHNHSVKPGSETHFRVVVVSPIFEGKSLVARHQLIYTALATEMKSGLHALAITSRTPEEWAKSPEALVSPACMGKGGAKAT